MYIEDALSVIKIMSVVLRTKSLTKFIESRGQLVEGWLLLTGG